MLSISMSAFRDEMEKIAVSPGWITGKLEGMAAKVVPSGGGNRGLMQRASRVANPSTPLGRVQQGPAPLTPAMAARPTAPKTVDAKAKIDGANEKRYAYNQGRKSIQNASAADWGRKRVDGKPVAY